MSGCYVNPVVGNAKDLEGLKDVIEYEAYRPGDIRLYGRPAKFYDKQNKDENINEMISEIDGKIRSIGDDSIIDDIGRLIDYILKSSGVVGNGVTIAVFDGKSYSFLPVSLGGKVDYIKSIGVIYGYAYEGHCYKLPKPQIMCLSKRPSKIAKGDCGCDCGFDSAFGYAVWSIDKLDRAISLDVRAGDLKTLVLDENMPGNRSPLAYAQTMALAPQRQRD
ncbi:hypothetical protein GFB56_05585 [Ensifer sp. T173]|uniref:Uncharacterized protein n=1 Tax=Ensifer canadensis TaxID=555315 RepID=A0AAW4FDQ4_9HYPH|nr:MULTISPECIES: hypothetical protein [Ensifer]MBD9488030.1 hypothetical protein [Ensifer sp. ENS11]MBM3090285.1 hypothetical protein [Ensifer canadensis]UBI80328.1 hypothetical protein J3R84_36170 [Ensifer canadensis]